MATFMITPVEKGIMRCQHTATMSHEDVRTLATFLYDYRGKLLVDLRGTTGVECMKNLRQFRPLMPTTAIFGAEIDPEELKISESYYTHEVQIFPSEEEALQWLRNQ
jgi:hypothetical protein